jgi:hypothetical protein
MAIFRQHSRTSVQPPEGHAHRFGSTLVRAAFLWTLALAALSAADVSGQVSVTHGGFARIRSNGVWTATLTVKNVGRTNISGPVDVVLTKLSANVTMVNHSGVRNGDPYITVSVGSLDAGASASVMIQFTNPSNGFISFTPVTSSGGS